MKAGEGKKTAMHTVFPFSRLFDTDKSFYSGHKGMGNKSRVPKGKKEKSETDNNTAAAAGIFFQWPRSEEKRVPRRRFSLARENVKKAPVLFTSGEERKRRKNGLRCLLHSSRVAPHNLGRRKADSLPP